MSILSQVLGEPGRDNAVLATVQTGKSIHRVLFDCGDVGLVSIRRAELQKIDLLCFSHLHMDHIGGFDTFFRTNFDADSSAPIRVYGPPQTARILQHRFQGFLWNLAEGRTGRWIVHDVTPGQLHAWEFYAAEAFAVAHDRGAWVHDGAVLADHEFQIEAVTMDHLTPSLAYVLREAPRRQIDTERMQAMELPAGPWLREVKDRASNDEERILTIDQKAYRLGDLRQWLLKETPGECIAYLTDFLLDETAMDRLVPLIQGCQVVICESQYIPEDDALALRHHHMTATRAAELARRAGVGELVLFHLSERYTPAQWIAMLAQARAIFPATRFPDHWDIR